MHVNFKKLYRCSRGVGGGALVLFTGGGSLVL